VLGILVNSVVTVPILPFAIAALTISHISA
jgi:hypothetical protein